MCDQLEHVKFQKSKFLSGSEGLTLFYRRSLEHMLQIETNSISPLLSSPSKRIGGSIENALKCKRLSVFGLNVQGCCRNMVVLYGRYVEEDLFPVWIQGAHSKGMKKYIDS